MNSDYEKASRANVLGGISALCSGIGFLILMFLGVKSILESGGPLGVIVGGLVMSVGIILGIASMVICKNGISLIGIGVGTGSLVLLAEFIHCSYDVELLANMVISYMGTFNIGSVKATDDFCLLITSITVCAGIAGVVAPCVAVSNLRTDKSTKTISYVLAAVAGAVIVFRPEIQSMITASMLSDASASYKGDMKVLLSGLTIESIRNLAIIYNVVLAAIILTNYLIIIASLKKNGYLTYDGNEIRMIGKDLWIANPYLMGAMALLLMLATRFQIPMITVVIIILIVSVVLNIAVKDGAVLMPINSVIYAIIPSFTFGCANSVNILLNLAILLLDILLLAASLMPVVQVYGISCQHFNRKLVTE